MPSSCAQRRRQRPRLRHLPWWERLTSTVGALRWTAQAAPIVTGITSSHNFPTTPGAYDTSCNSAYGTPSSPSWPWVPSPCQPPRQPGLPLARPPTRRHGHQRRRRPEPRRQRRHGLQHQPQRPHPPPPARRRQLPHRSAPGRPGTRARRRCWYRQMASTPSLTTATWPHPSL